MTTFTSAIAKLEFDKVLHRISRFAVSELAKKVALHIVPSIDRDQIVHELSLVSEAKTLLVQTGSVPLDGVKDIRAAVKKSLAENSHLEPQELLDIGSTLRASRLLAGYLAKHKHDAPAVSELADGLHVDKVVEYNIEQALDEQGRVKDQASKELRTIRQNTISVSEQLRRKLDQILKRVSELEFLQEEIITTRDGRMVIPVKSEFKKQVPGFIHSSSASGATMFIEPAETLELNNELRELQLREQREIARILRELTAQVREISDQLASSIDVLTTLDLIFARGRYSIDVIGIAPYVSQDRTIRLFDARHPVLLQRHERSEVVPLTLELSNRQRTLVITGPNAGGKSVALKTVGLLALCAQAGIHIPASPESTLCVFSEIFVDIGDDQSIENDLSTFSSHLQSYRHISDHANSTSLVLLDEIGAGTDPREGGALGSAILKELTRRQCFVIATTHQGSLKILAHNTDGMINGSMEFDQRQLIPTYRFLAGVPGGSYAVELAERLGLSSTIINEARTEVGPEHQKLEKLLADLQERKQHYDELVATVTREQARVAALIQEYEGRLSGARAEVKEIRHQARKEVAELVRSTKKSIEHLVKKIREEQASKQTIRDAQEAVKELLDKVEEAPQPPDLKTAASMMLGDHVRLRGSTEVGEIVEVRKDEALVAWDHGTIKVSLGLLERATERPRESRAVNVAHVPGEIHNELDIRGLRGEEIGGTVEQFLDSAFLNGLHRVDIIHGKGTGALRKKVSEVLQSAPHVKSFRLGEWNEGGTGVTVVELDFEGS